LRDKNFLSFPAAFGLTGLLPASSVRKDGVEGSYIKNVFLPYREAPCGSTGRLHKDSAHNLINYSQRLLNRFNDVKHSSHQVAIEFANLLNGIEAEPRGGEGREDLRQP